MNKLPGYLLIILLCIVGKSAMAFCGFYVAKADTKLFNKASKVIMVRDKNRTVITMANDFKGDPKEFAIVIPVPTVLQREQVHVTNRAIVDHLDAYTSPRLVEYHDGNPCRLRIEEKMSMSDVMPRAALKKKEDRAKSLGITN